MSIEQNTVKEVIGVTLVDSSQEDVFFVFFVNVVWDGEILLV